jgi:hypothetical protein
MLSGDRSSSTPFNVVIMYEDFETEKQAKKGLDYVANEFGSDFEIRLWMWRLDTLQDPKRSVRATPSFAESDLLVISLRGKRKIPAKIHWLIDERLAQAVNHACAPVASGARWEHPARVAGVRPAKRR